MASAATYTVSVISVGHVSGDAPTVPAASTISSSVGERQVKTLSSGANTITVPSGATLVVMVPPSGNTQTLTLKGISGDTGIEMSKTLPTAIGLRSVSSFVVTAGGTVTGMEFTFY